MYASWTSKGNDYDGWLMDVGSDVSQGMTDSSEKKMEQSLPVGQFTGF